jgi:hypothetical protein
MLELQIPCSPEQEDVIADHLISGSALGILPDERAWIISYVRKQYPTAKIKSADLDLSEAIWLVQFDI